MFLVFPHLSLYFVQRKQNLTRQSFWKNRILLSFTSHKMFKSRLNLKLFSFFWARWISGFCSLFCRINCTLQFVLFVGQILAAPWKLMIQQLISLLSLSSTTNNVRKVCICKANLVIQFVNWVWPIVYIWLSIQYAIVFIKQLQTPRAICQIMEKSWEYNLHSIFWGNLQIIGKKQFGDHHWPLLQIINFQEQPAAKEKRI